jgi:hypothetical protein
MLPGHQKDQRDRHRGLVHEIAVLEEVPVLAQALAVVRREDHQRVASHPAEQTPDPVIGVGDLRVVERRDLRERLARQAVQVEEGRHPWATGLQALQVEGESAPVHHLVERRGRVVDEVRIHVVHPEQARRRTPLEQAQGLPGGGLGPPHLRRGPMDLPLQAVALLQGLRVREGVEALLQPLLRARDTIGADGARPVPGLAEDLGQGDGLLRELLTDLPHAVLRRIPRGEDRGERLRGAGDGSDRLGEDDALARQPIDVGRSGGGMAGKSEPVGPERVDADQEHVGARVLLPRSAAGHHRGQQRHQRTGPRHRATPPSRR